MRVALFSGIHGNITALNAVLADIEAPGGVDKYWILGDLAALGPSPVAVVERASSGEAFLKEHVPERSLL